MTIDAADRDELARLCAVADQLHDLTRIFTRRVHALADKLKAATARTAGPGPADGPICQSAQVAAAAPSVKAKAPVAANPAPRTQAPERVVETDFETAARWAAERGIILRRADEIGETNDRRRKLGLPPFVLRNHRASRVERRSPQ